MKISTQVSLSYFLIVGLAAYFFLSVFVTDIKPGVTHSVEDSLVDTSNILAELARPDLLAGRINSGTFAEAVRAYNARPIDASIAGIEKSSLDYRIYITDARGTVVFDSANRDLGADFSRWNDVYLSLRGKYGARSTLTDPHDQNSAVMHVAAAIKDQDRIIGVLTVSKPDSAIEPFIARSERTVRTQGAALLLVAAAIGVFFAFRLTRSIERLRRYAKDVALGSRVALPATMNREIAELGQALEGMREQLDGKLYVEQYVYALTHELKSPVAAIRGAAELLGEDDVPASERARFALNIKEQSERIRVIADRLLELAKLEHLHALSAPVPVNLTEIAAALCVELGPRLSARQLRCEVIGHAEIDQGDPFLVSQAIRNLIDNAIDFSPLGGLIRIALTETDEYALIEISDSGPGIPSYAGDRVFERFYSLQRPGGSPKSTGLGLPLVAEIAKLHGGRVSLDNAAHGGALAVLVLRRT